MNTKIISAILDRISENMQKKACIISKENFKRIEPIRQDRRIAFVDGGQAELFRAVDFSLQFIRVVALTFRDNRKIGAKTSEFFVLISSAERDDNILFQTEIFPVKGKTINAFSINSLEQTIKKGNERAEISAIGNITRRFSELQLAKEAANELDEGDIIVIDGNLKAMAKGEEDYLKALFEAGVKRGIIVASLAKTSRIFMEKGSCLLAALNEQGGNEYPWHYDIKERAVAKLNKSSEHVFEFNIYDKQKEKMEEVLGVLAGCANDTVFPGYPYGLILADRLARVSNQEKGFLMTLFRATAGNSWKRLKTAINVLNSHDKLDSIS